MADDKEREYDEAQEKHKASMSRLTDLRGDVHAILSDIINRYYDRTPDDLIYEREERGYIRDDLHKAIRRIDETINDL